jgi:hypothetical protein
MNTSDFSSTIDSVAVCSYTASTILSGDSVLQKVSSSADEHQDNRDAQALNPFVVDVIATLMERPCGISNQANDVVRNGGDRQPFHRLLQFKLRLGAPIHGLKQRLILPLYGNVHTRCQQLISARNSLRQRLLPPRYCAARIHRGRQTPFCEFSEGLHARYSNFSKFGDSALDQLVISG